MECIERATGYNMLFLNHSLHVDISGLTVVKGKTLFFLFYRRTFNQLQEVYIFDQHFICQFFGFIQKEDLSKYWLITIEKLGTILNCLFPDNSYFVVIEDKITQRTDSVRFLTQLLQPWLTVEKYTFLSCQSILRFMFPGLSASEASHPDMWDQIFFDERTACTKLHTDGYTHYSKALLHCTKHHHDMYKHDCHIDGLLDSFVHIKEQKTDDGYQPSTRGITSNAVEQDEQNEKYQKDKSLSDQYTRPYSRRSLSKPCIPVIKYKQQMQYIQKKHVFLSHVKEFFSSTACGSCDGEHIANHNRFIQPIIQYEIKPVARILNFCALWIKLHSVDVQIPFGIVKTA
jgi:hypothetical protein